jgi:hypothetical protein
MSNNTQILQDQVTVFASEAEKFWGGNNAAGSRARKALQEIIKYGRTERKRIQEEKNTRKAAKSAPAAL